LQESFPIEENETAGEVHDKMKEIGARVLVETVKGIADGTLQERPQTTDNGQQSSIVGGQSSPIKHAPKIFTETCQIDWRRSIDEIHNLVRGLSPFPGAFTELGDKTLKIFKSEKEQSFPTSKPGRWESDGKTYLKFAAKDGYILLKDIQLEGKKRMPIEDFLRGYRFG